ncbi:MAG: hypothetical protein WCE79_29530 [Xanthobacteraceae bacterium]
MSSDETPKIEPTLTDAPSIAPEIKPETAEIITPKTEPEAAKPEAPEIKVEAKAEPAKIEPKVEAKAETTAEAPTLPPAPQIEPAKAIILRRVQPKTEKPAARASTSRFALLAACIAIAASFGAIGGSLGVAKFGHLLAPQAEPVAVAAAKDPADDIKALKDTITQLRAFTKSLSDNVTALKTTVNTTTAAASQQSSKITESLERIEKAQAEQRKLMAAQAAPETTGSISAQKQAATATPVPMVLGDPPTTLKPPILHDYVLRRVYDGAALIESRHGIIEVEPGIVAPGIGRIEAIKRQDGRWVVVTARGLIVQR